MPRRPRIPGDPNGVEGVTGSPAVTGAEVLPGTYTLAERGPDGYDASAWRCAEDGRSVPVTDGRVALAGGDTVTCVVTNTDRNPGPTPSPSPTPTPSPEPTPTPTPGPTSPTPTNGPRPSTGPGDVGGLPATGYPVLIVGAGGLFLVGLGVWFALRARRHGTTRG